MRKKFLSALMLGALTLAATSTITSCKDYDGDVADVKKDVTSLQELVKKLDAAIAQANNDHATKAALETAQKTLQDAINKLDSNKADKTQVQADIDEVKGAIQAAQNLAGKNKEDIAKLLEDFLKYQTTVSDTYVALGQLDAALAAQKTIIDLKDADNAFKGDIVALKGEVTAIKAENSDLDTRVKALESSVKELSSKLGDLDVLSIALASDLRSLVYRPSLYFGGIESIEYPFIADTTLVSQAATTMKRSVAGASEQNITIPEGSDYKETATSTKIVQPLVATVDYHMNPAFANVTYSDILGYNVREAEVKSRGEALPTVISPEKTANGVETVFKTQNGILTAGLQVTGADTWLVEKAKAILEGKADTKADYIVSLKAKTKTGVAEKKDSVITSDYAMLYPEAVVIEGLAYCAKYNNKDIPGSNVLAEENLCIKPAFNHLWDTPQLALEAYEKPAFDINFKDDKGIKLEDYLAVHIINTGDTKTAKANAKQEVKFSETSKMNAYGLTYEFNPVLYTIGQNKTSDSKFCTLDPKTGLIKAFDVNADGSTSDRQTEASVGRQPLVQVIVKLNGKIVLDGYILVNIVKEDPKKDEPKSIEITDFAQTDKEFDGCNIPTLNEAGVNNTWAQFDAFVLNQADLKAKGMTKDIFDNTYVPLAKDGDGVVEETGSHIVYFANVYSKVDGKYVAANDSLGEIKVIYDPASQNNHTFNWTITPEQAEKILQDKKEETVVAYFCYKAKDGANTDIEKIYIKVQAKLTRKQYNVTWGEKNNNYWYAKTGADEGTEAIIFDMQAPRDNAQIPATQWASEIKSTLVGNVAKFMNGTTAVNTHKYYFAPVDSKIKDLNGTEWTITVKKNANDKAATQLFCKYDEKNIHNYSEGLSILNDCAIRYDKGAFNNVNLYATKNPTEAEYHLIATLNAETGQITLNNTEETRFVLNAVGYKADNSNIMDELHATVGVISKLDCVATYTQDSEFVASWQRPINLKDIEGEKVAIDAKTNENTIYLVDLIKLYDWRGETAGYMWGDQTWFWAYYRVNSITIDIKGIKTNMHQASPETFKKLSDITTQAQIFALGGSVNNNKTYTFDLDEYNKASKNTDLINLMNNSKATFGAIVYANNGDNVTEFDLQVPVEVGYAWGSFKTTLKIKVQRTTGH